MVKMVNIFISYRRSDGAGYAGRLASSLEALVGSGRVFRDIEDIKPGDDFVEAIEQSLKNAAVCLVVIGKDWLDAKDDQGQRRLDNFHDYVRLEIETALRLKSLIIPVLVGDAVMPDAKALPSSLAALAKRQACEITDSRWDQDIERLLQILHQRHSIKPDKGTLQRRRLFSGKGYLAAALAIAGLFFIAKLYFSVPDISGKWYFEKGDYLLIRQDGDHFAIERIDPAMQTTYEKGTGVIKGRRLEFDLEPVYSQQYRYRGNLEVSWKENKLNGELLEVLSDQSMPVELIQKDK
jgi:hypothetical protein